MSKISITIAAVLGCIAISGIASAQTYTAISLATPQPGTQFYGSTLGTAFTVNSSIIVTSLGAFDAAIPSTSTAHTLNGTIVTTIYNAATQTAVAGLSATYTAASPGSLVGGYLFKTVGGSTGVALAPGNYVVSWTSITDNDQVAAGSSIPPPTYNNGNNLITVTQNTLLYNEQTATYLGQDKYPINSAGGQQLYGGTFAYTANTPEPGTVSLFAGLMVVGGSAMLRRRRLRKNAA